MTFHLKVAFIFFLIFLSNTVADQSQQQQRPSASHLFKVKRQNVTILAYNVNHLHYVFQVTVRPRNEGPRIERLNEALKRIGKTPETLRYGVPDVVVLTEVMSNKAAKEISKLDDFPHQTPRLGNDCQDKKFNSITGCRPILLNGGVKILSKFPILSTDGLIFSNRTTGEQLVNKGALRVRVRAPKTGAVFNVIGTHMQATDSSLQKTGTGAMIRRLQMREILDWIDTLEIPDSEPIFITGDLNVEFNSAEYRAFLNEFPLGIDYEKDEAVGGSFSAKFRGDSTNWLTSYHLYGSNVSQTDETLDYIVVHTDHRLPTKLSPMEILPLKSAESWYWWRMKGEWVINGTVFYHSGYYRDLSDHYPVIQRFQVETAVSDDAAESVDAAADSRPFR